eukprot:TRINITY_DN537_c0_g2_i1.p1 TRINITY_DN537_c0_g2~~TRINITY_DN537_c0_g2_i1.p1  ORF type:complete len:386 (+),score=102.07 TRINITY_DN537_c0_g2_i1:43-1200(+)
MAIMARSMLCMLLLCGGAGACQTVSDCNNAGRCYNGKCLCDPTWTGETCDALNQLPGPGPDGIGLHIETPEHLDTWGGSVMTERVNDTFHYHMYASAFPNATLNDWINKSVAVHAVSKTGPLGPYIYQGVVLGPRGDHFWDASNVHNPHVQKIGNEYVIFYIGMDYTDHPHTMKGDPWQAIGAAYSTSPYGPWTRLEEPLLTATRGWACVKYCGVSNPAVAVVADGTVVMIFRGNGDRGVGIATAKTWRGPWTLGNNGASIFPPGEVEGLEDGYIWSDPDRDGCHMVLHQHGPLANVGAHAFTTDRTCTKGWTLSQPRPSHAYSNEVRWASGNTTNFFRRERPQLIFDQAGYPTHLFNAVQVDPSQPTKSFTIGVPLMQWPGLPP